MKESMTLEQFMLEHSNMTIRIMSPGGYVTILPNRQTDRLVAHAGVSGTEMPVHWEELREQMVESCNYNEADESWYLLTAFPSQDCPAQSHELHM